MKTIDIPDDAPRDHYSRMITELLGLPYEAPASQIEEAAKALLAVTEKAGIATFADRQRIGSDASPWKMALAQIAGVAPDAINFRGCVEDFVRALESVGYFKGGKVLLGAEFSERLTLLSADVSGLRAAYAKRRGMTDEQLQICTMLNLSVSDFLSSGPEGELKTLSAPDVPAIEHEVRQRMGISLEDWEKYGS